MNKYWNFEPRRPRHQATDQETSIHVRLASDVDWHTATLVDISRNGIRLRHVPLCSQDDTVSLRIPLDGQRNSRTFSAMVRWCEEIDGARELACQCHEPMDWEVIGELILSGALEGS